MSHHHDHHTHTSHCGHEHCNCDHEHHHHHSSSTRGRLVWILSSALLLAMAVAADHIATLQMWQRLLLYLPSYLLIGFPTLKEAAEGLSHGDAFNEHFLMSIATIGALSIGFLPGGDEAFAEAVAVMLLFQVGEWAEGYAEGQSRRSIAHLVEMRPDIAHLATDGKGNSLSTTDVAPDTVEVGQTIVVRPGEKFPLDGKITSGSTTVNNMALTGESRPVSADVGSEVFSGCTNLSGVVSVKVTKPFSQSTAMRIIELVENAAERKAKSETFISRFARIYTPVVVVLAVTIAIVPPLLSGAFAESFATWLYRAMMFLVVSCPCALVISVPLTFFAGIGGASREGILIKGANFFDVLSNVGTVVFDKTGTLTRGQFAVEAVHGNTCDSGSEHTATAEDNACHDAATHLLHMAAHVEHHSSHPIAEALRQAFPQEGSDGCRVDDIEEIAGQGVCAVVEGRKVCIGNEKLMESIGAEWHDCTQSGTIVHIAIDGTYRGHIVVGDSIKPGSREAVEQLRSLGVASIIMLTGDNDAAARKVADELGISEWHAHLLPEAKLSRVDKLIATEPQGRRVAFVGDGINDAPVLRRADVGIAMGGMGSEAAIDAADVVVMDDNPEKVSAAIRRARSTQRIAWQNVVFAVGIKVVFLLLASLGMCTMWMAVFADVGVTVLAVLNAMRALK
ncbi:MAG: heavy metal translocating P-type ATPase [Prevotella sp.]|nr:heavy metal translocating P-type ATPase [Prevotella sp.]